MSAQSEIPPPSLKEKGIKVHVGGLSRTTESAALQTAFGAYGRILEVWIGRNPPGFAFVTFEEESAADEAIRNLHGTMLGDLKITVALATSRGPKPRRENNDRRGGGGPGGSRGNYPDSRYDDRRPRYDDRRPRYDDRRPPYDDRRPPYDDRRPPYDDRRPPYDDRRPPYDDRRPPYDERTGSGNSYDDRRQPIPASYDDRLPPSSAPYDDRNRLPPSRYDTATTTTTTDRRPMSYDYRPRYDYNSTNDRRGNGSSRYDNNNRRPPYDNDRYAGSSSSSSSGHRRDNNNNEDGVHNNPSASTSVGVHNSSVPSSEIHRTRSRSRDRYINRNTYDSNSSNNLHDRHHEEERGGHREMDNYLQHDSHSNDLAAEEGGRR